MRILLSIKPEFAEKIFNGTKKYEFRRSIFKDKKVNKVVVYASSPIQSVIGEFDIESILNDDLDKIWERTRDSSGISEDFYRKYFANRSVAYAIKIGRVKKYRKKRKLSYYNVAYAPQSFIYLD
ncbi:MAG: hypothetical protein HXN41_06355 [Prevotella histicola]|uniref:hypothetical protein n=1 Tax=Prevotella histicola TaxID=470565 RepID=UPI001CADFE1B|nr:hypothetical protein [Prevotella histicola]MBF1425363.1 hypothetical protein [Prevotella histicola]